jgi:hypothetical protein
MSFFNSSSIATSYLLISFVMSYILISTLMKKIGFLSFGHWSNHPAYKTRTASDTLLQSIDLAVAAEEIGIDGAYFRVHHFATQLASPFPFIISYRRQNNSNRDRDRCD